MQENVGIDQVSQPDGRFVELRREVQRRYRYVLFLISYTPCRRIGEALALIPKESIELT